VYQYDPVRKRHLKNNDPDNYLIEHILKGDRGDGIPNVLSQGDTFVVGKRQKPLRQTTINTITSTIGDVPLEEVERNFSEDWVPNFVRNRTLVDLSLTPSSIGVKVLHQFDQEPPQRGKLFNYFIKHQLKGLMENIGEF
jgi:hypothetical protein